MYIALLAEPKTPLESIVFILLALRSRVRTAVIAQALSVTHACISLPHACNHERSIIIYGRNAENEPVSHTKWPTTVRMGTLQLSSKNAFFKHHTETASMPTLSLSCVGCR